MFDPYGYAAESARRELLADYDRAERDRDQKRSEMHDQIAFLKSENEKLSEKLKKSETKNAEIMLELSESNLDLLDHPNCRLCLHSPNDEKYENELVKLRAERNACGCEKPGKGTK